ncbi:hypothetical protein Q8F55_003979 [Vanrija albida]|uniref:L-type lectin-like domain-containing protein n=1 Tax=Vanrija albida TaxID=181172 RepID=A0ABR3Q5G6_9TREE
MLRPVTALALALCALSPVMAAAEEKPIVDMVEKRVALRTHSIAMPYVDSDLQNRWWDFGGDTIINTNKHIRLTQDRQSESGWLWSRMPLAITNWQVDVEFKVDGKSNGMYGDGFAIFVTKERATTGPVFGSADHFTGLGLFFDTYANTRHSYSFPRITAMLGDGKTKYDLDGDNAAGELAGCSENFRRRDVATKARLTYVQGRGLQVQLHLKEWDKWETCFETKVELPDNPFLGFSAITGALSDNHDIVSVATYSATLLPQYRAVPGGKQQPLAAPIVANKGSSFSREGAPGGRKPSSSRGASGWFLFILKAIGLLAFVAFAVAAYRTYSAQQRTRPAYY